jgi:predicted ATPase/class 3 adenylate cyclase
MITDSNDSEIPLLEPLTRREQEVLELLAEGLTGSEMAERLTLAVSSVRWYVQQIYGKLGVNSKRQAIRRARALGLLRSGVSILAAISGPDTVEASLPTGTVTFLFTDIEGSTPRWESHPQQMAAAIQVHNAALRQAIEANGGLVFKTVGDAFQAAFDTAPQALKGAIAGQRALQAASWNELGPLKVRMGVHTGEAMLGPGGDEYAVSHTKNRVARILSAAHGGQVLLSQECADLVRRSLPEGVTLEDIGEHSLKGLQQLEHLYQVIAPDLSKDFPPLASAMSHAHNLPVQRTSFIGRQAQVIQVKELLRQHTLVTLTGSGGVGKTRLSLQAAAELVEQFADGVWLVELAPVVDPTQVTQAVASVLGLKTGGGEPVHEILLDYLHGKQALLVLDNCEHLIEACASLANDLLKDCWRVKILASSREALGVVGEIHFRVPSMSLPDSTRLPELAEMEQFEAVRLFSERARAVRPDFQVTTQNAPEVAQICQRLDGIPLAIELAAARLNILTTGQLFHHLENAFRLLTGGARTALPRQQTLRATIDWSYLLLSQKEQELLRRLSVFTGSFDLPAVEAVGCLEAGEQMEVLDLLASLANKSMLSVETLPDLEMRYGLLETVRQYARENLENSGESQRLHELHAAYYLYLAKQGGSNLFNRQAALWVKRLDVDFPNIRVAFIWALESQAAEDGIEALLALWYYWLLRNIKEEGHALLEKALKTVNAEHPSEARAGLLSNLGFLGIATGIAGDIRENLIASREMYRVLGNRAGYAWPTLWLGMFEGIETIYYAESAAIFRELGDDEGYALMLWLSGVDTRDAGNLEQAELLLKECERLYRKMGSWRLGVAYYDLAYLYFKKGQPQLARRLFNQALPLVHEVADQWSLMWLYYFKGEMELAEASDTRSLHTAEAVLIESLEIARKFGNKFKFNLIIPVLLANKAQKLSEYAFARGRYRETLSLYQGFLPNYKFNPEDLSNVGQCLLGLAEAAVCLDQAAYSTRLVGALDGVAELDKEVLRDIKPENVERIADMTRSRLLETDFQAAWAEGRSMTLEQAIALGLEEIPPQSSALPAQF